AGGARAARRDGLAAVLADHLGRGVEPGDRQRHRVRGGDEQRAAGGLEDAPPRRADGRALRALARTPPLALAGLGPLLDVLIRLSQNRDMDPFQHRRVGNTAFQVTQLGMGGASLGDMRESLPEALAVATVEAAHAAGISYFDTSPWYGNGKSELRFGHVLRTKPRGSFVLSTKVGRVHSRPADPDNYKHPAWVGGLPFEPRFDYTHDGILKSYEMSLARLGLNRVEALLIHDLDPGFHGSEEGVASRMSQLDTGDGYRALVDLKARGEIEAIGVGINLVGMIPRFLERFPVDFFLVAMPYTL